jgi:glycosyltransferase involved in cell wall biosynthesis/thymidylate kinase
MSQVLPRDAELPRDLVICFGFAAERRRRQPWHMAHGLATGLAALGRAVTIVTDVTDQATADAGPGPGQPYAIMAVPELARRGRPSPALRQLSRDLAPSRIYLVTGAFAIARMTPLELGAPTDLVIASPRLSLREILAVGPMELWRERRLMLLPLVNALLPGRLIARGFRRSGAVRPIYLSRAGRERYRALGLPSGPLLRPQVDPQACLAHPALNAAAARPPTVAYLGPPLALRGAHLALAAFEAAVARGLDARLLLLLRPDVAPEAMRRFVKTVHRSPATARIEVRTEMLDAAEIARAFATVDAFLFPFRAPVSEVPLVVIEAGLTGRPVIALDAPGVTECVHAMGGLVAKSVEELPHALIRALRQRREAAVDPGGWTSWVGSVEAMLAEPEAPPLRQKLVALCGVDGTGKSFLLAHLREHYAKAGVPSRHVWSRFRNYLSKPFLALTRFTGDNYKVEVKGVRIGYHDFQAKPWLAWPFLVLQTIDQVLDIVGRYHLPRWLPRWLGGRPEPVLGDRCVFDTLVDLAVDTGLDDLVIDRIGPRLVGLLPRPNLVVLIDRHPLRIQEQRGDALLDRHFHRRRTLYRRVAARFGLPVVDNNGPVVRTLEAVEALIREIPGANAPADLGPRPVPGPGHAHPLWPERQSR